MIRYCIRPFHYRNTSGKTRNTDSTGLALEERGEVVYENSDRLLLNTGVFKKNTSIVMPSKPGRAGEEVSHLIGSDYTLSTAGWVNNDFGVSTSLSMICTARIFAFCRHKVSSENPYYRIMVTQMVTYKRENNLNKTVTRDSSFHLLTWLGFHFPHETPSSGFRNSDVYKFTF